ncbi:hypothetical protein YC2023_121440 [Brassica napus]
MGFANAVAFLRVALSLSDHTDSAAFLAFDMEVAKLTNIQASEAAQIVVDTDFPQSLADIVGNTYTFQLKVTEFNFTSNHKTFTISRIFPQRKLAPMPASVVNVCLFHCFEFDLTRNLKHAPSFGLCSILGWRRIIELDHLATLTREKCSALVRSCYVPSRTTCSSDDIITKQNTKVEDGLGFRGGGGGRRWQNNQPSKRHGGGRSCTAVSSEPCNLKSNLKVKTEVDKGLEQRKVSWPDAHGKDIAHVQEFELR